MMQLFAEYSAIVNPTVFSKTECVGKKLKNIAPNVKAAMRRVAMTYRRPLDDEPRELKRRKTWIQ